MHRDDSKGNLCCPETGFIPAQRGSGLASPSSAPLKFSRLTRLRRSPIVFSPPLPTRCQFYRPGVRDSTSFLHYSTTALIGIHFSVTANQLHPPRLATAKRRSVDPPTTSIDSPSIPTLNTRFTSCAHFTSTLHRSYPVSHYSRRKTIKPRPTQYICDFH